MVSAGIGCCVAPVGAASRRRMQIQATMRKSHIAETFTPAPSPSVVTLLTRLAVKTPTSTAWSTRADPVAPGRVVRRAQRPTRAIATPMPTMRPIHHASPASQASIITLIRALCAPPSPVSSKNTPLAEVKPSPCSGRDMNDSQASVQISVRRLNVPICSTDSPRLR